MACSRAGPAFRQAIDAHRRIYVAWGDASGVMRGVLDYASSVAHLKFWVVVHGMRDLGECIHERHGLVKICKPPTFFNAGRAGPGGELPAIRALQRCVEIFVRQGCFIHK